MGAIAGAAKTFEAAAVEDSLQAARVLGPEEEQLHEALAAHPLS